MKHIHEELEEAEQTIDELLEALNFALGWIDHPEFVIERITEVIRKAKESE